jgi:hypothetical protein
VQNFSASGARSAFTAADELPLELVLAAPALGLKVKARLVWSQGKCHGVGFLWPQKTGRR